jgi:prepilin-type N-terminal cleavage/methylation domain-containing protein
LTKFLVYDDNKLMNILPKSTSSKKGFTLIELLIAVSIIAVLAVIGIIVIGNVQVRARDARRNSDLDAIATALEVAKNNLATTDYPVLATTLFSSGVVPVDPTRSYCGASGTAAAITGLANPAAWTSTTCAGVTGYATVAPGNPAANPAWKICASLEQGGVVCRSNQQ